MNRTGVERCNLAELLTKPNHSAKWQWFQWLAIGLGLLAVEASFGLCTQDDAFISFRYARNVVEGHGLVFNPGEHVEGITNLLWTLFFVPVLALGLEPAPVSASMGMLSSLALLAVVWRMNARCWLTVLLVALVSGIAMEGVQGLETVAFAALVAAALAGEERWAWWAGIATWVRPEGVAVAGVLWLMRRSARDLFIVGGFVLVLTAFRLGYYGDIVPNTFHAKVGGFALSRGFVYIWDFVQIAPVLAALGAAGLVVALVRRSNKSHLEAAVLVVFYLVYVVAVGGDFKGTSRFLIPAVPALAILGTSVLGTRPRWRVLTAVVALSASIPGFRFMAHHADRFHDALIEKRVVGEVLDARLPKNAWIAIHAAGIIPYYARRPTIDMWGITDPHIARARVEMGQGVAGHERHDYAYVLERAPLVILPDDGLLTQTPLDLGDPRVFGNDFLRHYESASTPVPMGSLNLWRRKQ